ncbi:MAG: chitobiase/beta-hexosaminidase C-terminal domain-containing protein [Treponema sp.]|uniref:alpha-amylase family glycosyl hydrolase n=1 Tax=Treponema sp. TaxID=166 RepID=UPI0025CDF4C9|nr:alpha-amylase family glycosyl hydrolase [Treponema sp.]MBQ9282335.1 chitobiase/beta-hexosaminidase C-terminal domain-containing protein [Treponema sp.]
MKMKQRRKSGFLRQTLCIGIAAGLFFSGCSFLSIGDSDSGDSGSSSSGALYGSLSLSGNIGARALETSSIVAADVSVTGSGISSEAASSLKKENVEISDGKASGVVISNIPVGKNRLVTVEAKTSINNILAKLAGGTMTAVTDIVAGSNSVSVNWESSKIGNVYAELLSLGYDVSSLSPDTVKTYLPADTHAALIDSASLAADIKSGAVGSPSQYKLSAGSVTFTSDSNLSNITFQVCDPASEKYRSIKIGENTVSNVAPGKWKVFAIADNSTVLFSTSITVESGKSVDLGEISFKSPSPRLEDKNGCEISEFITGTTTVYLRARTYDGEEELSGTSIYYTLDGSEPTESSAKYTSSGISVNIGTTLKAFALCSYLSASDIVSWEFDEPKLGYTHPSSGDYSVMDESSWASANYPLGANVSGGNTTFALYSANATKVLLEIYDSAYGKDAKYDYWLTKNTSTNIWNAKLSGDLSGAIYAYRVWGPNWTYSSDWKRGGSNAGFVSDCDSSGNRFNPNKVVFDPYAKEMTHDPSNASAIASYKTTNSSYALAVSDYQILSTGETTPSGSTKPWREFDSGTISPKGYVITDSTGYGTKPAIPQKDAIIYEAHVRGITKHSSAANLSSLLSGYDGFDDVVDIPEEYRGTYKGAALLVPYLKALGINTIELLPVHETDNDANPDDGPGGNFWGYMTFDYFAPDRRYSSDKSAGGPTREFKEMVKTFHDAGMEVYLDVVFNHTGEGGTWHGSSSDANFDSGKQCTVVSMRGIDNQTYYSLVNGTKWSYWETTGCGNNMQCDNSVVRKFIIDSLTYWIDEMGVDGFRFDLATTLGREYNSSTGNWNYNSSAATLTQIASLGKTKNAEMIAESWDCGDNSYQVGNFPDGWAGWNGYYRDTLRGFVGNAACSANIPYSDALYGDMNHFSTKDPSVNFIVAHDGFTLADLCSYSGSGNYYNDKLSWPFGPSDGGNGDNNAISTGTDAASRRQRARNYFAMQMFSAGIPMIVYGDEFGRTQNGNNNPYNIDSVATWNNYNMIPTASPHKASTGSAGKAECGSYNDMFGTFGNTSGKNGLFEFARFVMNERLDNESLRQLTGTASGLSYHKNTYTESGYNGSSDLCLGLGINLTHAVDGAAYYVMINMVGSEVNFTFPAPSSGYRWTRIVDTGDWAETNSNFWEDTDTSCNYTSSGSYDVGAYRVVILKEVSDGPVTPTCATPAISGNTPFETSTSVTITCGTSGASIYYTTNGSSPSASSTKYTGEFSLSATTTVKAIAICDGYNNSSVASKQFRQGEVDSSKSGVMLQGFNWESASRTTTSKQNKWYGIMTAQADSINDTFEYIWCPPPTMSASMGPEGYMPTQLNVLDSFYGTETELRNLLSKFTKTKAIADIVINHRCGSTNWGDFTNPDFGVVKGSDYSAICSDDEGFNASNSDMYNISKRGAADTGGQYADARDLDHTNATVQAQIVEWMNSKLKDVGFVGWRYDYVKGYDGYYVGKYDKETNAQFSVGELWEDFDASNPNGLGDTIKNWISKTENGGYRSKAFDFALKGILNTVFGNKGTGIVNSNYAFLENAASLMVSQPGDAVTFVDNHDTGSTQGHWYLDPNDIGTAYAFILTHPGVPCVAWQHYFSDAESGGYSDSQYIGASTVPGATDESGNSMTYRQHIDKLIQIRKDIGIGYDSSRTTLSATNSVYAAKVEGTNGNLVVVIGGSYKPSGNYGRIYKGTNFTIWQEGAEDVYGGGETITLSVTVPDWVWNDSAVIFAWAWGASTTGEWINVSGSGTSATIVVPADTTGFNMARCSAGTSAPDWSATGNSAGRIYNKTADVSVPSGSYSTTWEEYNP